MSFYYVCPSCGNPLGDVYHFYRTEMRKIGVEFGIDYDKISQQNINLDEEYIKRRSDVLDACLERDQLCCKSQIIKNVDYSRLLKG